MEILKRTISGMMALVMVFGLLPTPALANQTEETAVILAEEELPAAAAETEQLSLEETEEFTAAQETTEPVETVQETTVPETEPEETVQESTVPETEPEETVQETTVPETEPGEIIQETTVPETEPEETFQETTAPETEPEETLIPEIVVEETEEVSDEAMGTAAIVDSGTCGTDATWTLYDDGLMIISGTGEMTRIQKQNPTKIIVEEGITALPYSAFSGYTNLEEIQLPTTLTSMGTYVFQNCMALKAIAIPEGITDISLNMFYNCVSLEEVLLPSTLTYISETAFESCTALRSIEIPEGVTSMGEGVFRDCTALEDIQLPSTLTVIPSTTFLGCTALKTIEIPEGVTAINSGSYNEGTFEGCSALETVILPDSLTKIGAYTFKNCTSLVSVTFSKGVTSIDGSAFDGCTALQEFAVDPENETYSAADGVLFSKDGSYLRQYPKARTGSYTVPETVTGLGAGAFRSCAGLTEITIPGYIYMGREDRYVFADCVNLTKVTLTSGRIGDYAFAGCTSLAEVELGSVSYIGVAAFSDCVSLETITLPQALTVLEGSAFADCTSLQRITLPQSLTTLGAAAFSGCSSLEQMEIPDSITVLGTAMFSNCSNLKSVKLPGNLTRIEANAFYCCDNLESIEIPDTVTSIGYEAFSYCQSLRSVKLSASLSTLETYAFYGCVALESIELPQSLTDMGEYLFGNCRALNFVTFPESMQVITYGSFQNCGLLELSLPASLAEIQGYAFAGCNKLTNVVLPESVETVGGAAFQDCTGLKALEILGNAVLGQDALNDIGVFDGCTGLETVKLSEGMTNLDCAFRNCTALKEVNIPGTVTTMRSAFWGCTALETVTLQDGLTLISDEAFEQCRALKEIQIPETVTAIGKDAFLCTGLESVTIPGSVETLGEFAFAYCDALASAVIGDGVQILERCVFINDPLLKELTIPASVTSLGSSLVADCTGLETVTFRGNAPVLNGDVFGYASFTGYYPYGNPSWEELLERYIADVEWVGYDPNETSSGQCGDEITWTMDAGSGVLTISGTGAIYDYSAETSPWYQFRKSIGSVVMSEGITHIGDYAFQNIVYLKEITLPSTVVSVGQYAFAGCSGMKLVDIPDGVKTLGDYAFTNCTALLAAWMPDNAESLGAGLFAGCTKLENVVFLGPAPTIAADSFQNVTARILYLESESSWAGRTGQNYGGTLTWEPQKGNTLIYTKSTSTNVYCMLSLEDGAVSVANTTTSVDPEHKSLVRKIHVEGSLGDFSDCPNLKTVTYDVLYTGSSGRFSNCTSLETVSPGVYSVTDNAFSGCTSLKEISIDGNVGMRAFAGCTALKTVNLTKNVELIGDEAFRNCQLLTAIELPDTLKSIGTEAFMHCESMRELTIPDEITEIPDGAFRDMDNLEQVVLPAGLLTIGPNAFRKCAKLNQLSLPAGLTEIGDYAFYNAFDLMEITFPASLTKLGAYAFDVSGLNVAKFLGNAPQKGTYPFATAQGNDLVVYYPGNNSTWTETERLSYSVRIRWLPYGLGDDSGSCGEGLTWQYNADTYTLTISGSGPIGSYLEAETPWAAYNDKVCHVVVADGVTAIGAGAFREMKMETVQIAGSVLEIGDMAFQNCDRLTDVQMNDGLVRIGAYLFQGCDDLKLVQLPDSVTEAAEYALADFMVRKVILSKNLDEIPAYLFLNSWCMTTVEMGDVTAIGESAFDRCENLTEIQLGNRLSSIGNRAFALTALTEVTFPATLRNLGEEAFASCDELKTIRFNGNAFENYAEITNTFEDVEATVYFPAGNASWYSARKNYGGRLDWLAYTPDVVATGTCGDDLIWSLDGNGILTISGTGEMYDFRPSQAPWYPYREDILFVTLTEGVTGISYGAFRECRMLASVSIPASVSSIGEFAFAFSNAVIDLVVAEDSAYYAADSLTLFSKDRKTLVAYLGDFRDTYEIPAGTEAVAPGAFAGSSMLTNITIPESAARIGNGAFLSCGNLTEITVAENNAAYTASDNVLFSKDGTVLVTYPAGKHGAYTIPDGTVTIADMSFGGCANLSGIVIPQSITTIESNAFLDCTGLTTIRFLGNAPAIADSFTNVTATAYYPAGNDSWTEDVKQNYGGTITWVSEGTEVPELIASGTCGENLIWSLNADGLLTISGTGEMTDYTFENCGPWQEHAENILKIVVESGVTRIGNYAFKQCYNVQEISLPDSLSCIGQGAFMNCSALQSVMIPAAVAELGDWAFGHCNSLTEVQLSAAITDVPNHAFYYCSSLQNISIPEGVTAIGDNAFEDCSAMETITLPDGLMTIGRSAFSNCSGLTAVVLPDSVTTLGQDAFCYCENLTSVQIGSGLTTIAGRPFGGCTGLTVLTVSGENEFFVAADNVLFDADRTTLICCAGGKTGSYTIPDTVTAIASNAFEGCGISGVTIPDTVTQIGSGAFCRCRNLENVVLPNGITTIASETFSVCGNLVSIVIPGSVTDIGYSPFWLCVNLKEIRFLGSAPVFQYDNIFENITATAYYPANDPTWTSDVMQNYGGTITWVSYETEAPELVASGTCGENLTWTLDANGLLIISGTGAMTDFLYGFTPEVQASWYSYRNSINKVVIDSGVTTIGNYAFYNCNNLSSVTIPTGVVSIGEYAFNVCRSLSSITVPEGVTSIGECAFSACSGLTSVVLPEDITEIADQTFNNCMSLSSITIPESVTSIGRYAFGDCDGLTSITIPANVTRIGDFAFNQCSYLRSITLPDSLQEIGTEAFAYCQELTQVTIPASVTSLGNTPFYGCMELTEIQVEAGNAAYCSVDGVLFDKDVRTLLQYPNGRDGAYTIPDTVTEIGGSISYSVDLTELTVPESITAIPGYAFYYCTSLNRVTFLGEISSIGMLTFGSCDIRDIYFTGDAPVFEDDWIFDDGAEVNMHYPAGNATWTADVMQNYNGNLTWIPYGGATNRLTVSAADLAGHTTVWIDGVEYALQTDGDNCYVDLPDGNARTMVTHSYNIAGGTSNHTRYPVGMKVWLLENTDGAYTATRQEVFDNILQYSGMSIRVTGKKGIRMITSIEQDKKNALVSGGLEGLTLREYGTVVAWASNLTEGNPLVLGQSYAMSNYAYRRGVADPVFAYSGSLMQYTNVLVNFSDEQCKPDIALRPYMILEDANGETVTIYGGIVYRSIGYIAYQNRNVFEPQTDEYNYIWEIIRYVYGDVYDDEFVHAWTPPSM